MRKLFPRRAATVHMLRSAHFSFQLVYLVTAGTNEAYPSRREPGMTSLTNHLYVFVVTMLTRA